MRRAFTLEDEQRLWLALRMGMSISHAARSIDRSPATVWPMLVRTGGVGTRGAAKAEQAGGERRAGAGGVGEAD